jgi:biotin carboxylase
MIQSAERLTDYQIARVSRCSTVDLADPEGSIAAARALHTDSPFIGVTAFHEAYLVLAARIAEDLKILGNPLSAVLTAQNKADTRVAAEGSGFLNPRYVTTSKENFATDATFLTFPIVVKPSCGAGSVGVQIVNGLNELDDLELPEGQLIAEEFIEGPELSIEAISVNGEHHVVAITEKITTVGRFRMETGHTIPARIPDELSSILIEATGALLTNIGHQLGPSHTEVILYGPSQLPFLVETHTRYGGDRIWLMTGLTTGIYPPAAAISAAAGLQTLEVSAQAAAAAIRFFTSDPGTITSVDMPSEWSEPGLIAEVKVSAKAGDVIGQMSDSLSRLGHILAIGQNADAAAEIANEACRSVRVNLT